MQRLPNRITKRTDSKDVGLLFESLGEIVSDDVKVEMRLDEMSRMKEKPNISNPTDAKEGVVCFFVDALINNIITSTDIGSIAEVTGLPPKKIKGKQLIGFPELKVIYKNLSDFAKKKKSHIQNGNKYGIMSKVILPYLGYVFTLDLGEHRKKDIQAFNNSISAANLAHERFSSNLTNKSYCDMGDSYNTIRSNAVEMVSQISTTKLPEDKWCPADYFIYTSKNVEKTVVKFKDHNKYNGKDGAFLTYFSEDAVDSGSGIIPISLKEESHQEGAALSVTSILEDSGGSYSADIPTKYTTEEEDEEEFTKEMIDKLAKNIKKMAAGTGPKGSGWSKNSQKFKQYYWGPHKNTPTGSNNFWKTINNRNNKFKTVTLNGTKYSSEYFSTKFDEKKYKKFINDFNKERSTVETDDEINKFATAWSDSRTHLFQGVFKKQLKSTFVLENGAAHTEKPITRGDNDYGKFCPIGTGKKTHGVVAYEKTDVDNGCMKTDNVKDTTRAYNKAVEILSDLSTGKIKKSFNVLSKSNNPLAVMTAYAIGMAGYAPTFYKCVGSNDGTGGSINTVHGAGVLKYNPDGEKSNRSMVTDSINSTSISIKFLVDAYETTRKNAKRKKQYETKINFIPSRNSVSIQVNEMKEV